jgi:hypothetical protein
MTNRRIWRIAISVVTLLSLLANGLLIFTLLRMRRELYTSLLSARNTLALSASEPIAFDVTVDQPIPIRTDVSVDEVFDVPIAFAYPLETVVTTHINIPVLGRQEIAVPIETVIPIDHTLEVPIQMTVPISVTYQLQATIPVEVAWPPDLLEGLDALLLGLASGLQTPLK